MLNNIGKIACLSILLLGGAVHAMDVPNPYMINKQLIEAAMNGNVQRVEQLIRSGADVNTIDWLGQPVLIIAVRRVQATRPGFFEICKLFIENGANVNVQDKHGNTALIAAALGGRNELCQLLINNGADINIVAQYGETALTSAAQNRFKETCKLLIRTMIKPTPKQIDTVVALMGTKKFRKTEQLNLIGRDVVRMIGQEKYKAFEQENKPEAEKQIMKIYNWGLRDELLAYLKSL